MSTLQETLNQIKAEFSKKAPAEALEVFSRTTSDLIASGLHQKALSTGSQFPDFDLPDADGNTVSSADLLGSGPVIINFFRGFW